MDNHFAGFLRLMAVLVITAFSAVALAAPCEPEENSWIPGRYYPPGSTVFHKANGTSPANSTKAKRQEQISSGKNGHPHQSAAQRKTRLAAKTEGTTKHNSRRPGARNSKNLQQKPGIKPGKPVITLEHGALPPVTPSVRWPSIRDRLTVRFAPAMARCRV